MVFECTSHRIRESVDVAFGDVAFQICENGVFKEKNVRLNSAGCEPHSRSDECFLFENPIFTLLKRHVRKRHVYRLPTLARHGNASGETCFSEDEHRLENDLANVWGESMFGCWGVELLHA